MRRPDTSSNDYNAAKAGADRRRLMSPFGQFGQANRKPSGTGTETLERPVPDLRSRFDHLELDDPAPLPAPESEPEPALDLVVQTVATAPLPPVQWPIIPRDKPASREQLQALHEMASHDQLPENRPINPPTGRTVHDWNIAVRGSVQSYRHAKKTGNTAWMNFELADLDHFCFQVRIGALRQESPLEKLDRQSAGAGQGASR